MKKFSLSIYGLFYPKMKKIRINLKNDKNVRNYYRRNHGLIDSSEDEDDEEKNLYPKNTKATKYLSPRKIKNNKKHFNRQKSQVILPLIPSNYEKKELNKLKVNKSISKIYSNPVIENYQNNNLIPKRNEDKKDILKLQVNNQVDISENNQESQKNKLPLISYKPQELKKLKLATKNFA